MKTLKRLTTLLAFLSVFCFFPLTSGITWETADPAAREAQATGGNAGISPANIDYKINPGDVLNITVWREPDLKLDVLVRPDGKISFPLAGDIQAAGNSVEEVRILLTKQLEKLIPDLVVSVSMLQINGNKVFVIGQVNNPGEINANPYIDVMQALSIAGGANAFADVNNIVILRRSGGEQVAIPFDFSEVEDGKELQQNIILQAGDVIVVP